MSLDAAALGLDGHNQSWGALVGLAPNDLSDKFFNFPLKFEIQNLPKFNRFSPKKLESFIYSIPNILDPKTVQKHESKLLDMNHKFRNQDPTIVHQEHQYLLFIKWKTYLIKHVGVWVNWPNTKRSKIARYISPQRNPWTLLDLSLLLYFSPKN